MTTTRLDPKEWLHYFDEASETLRGRPVSIQVMAPDMGAQFVVENTGLEGIAYDPKDRQLDITLAGLDHRIRHPRDIHVDMTPHGIASIEVTDVDGRKHVIQIARPAGRAGRTA